MHVYVGSVGTAFVAADDRPDVGAAYPAVGSKHGFNVRVAVPGPGTHKVCTYAINAGPGTNRLLSCGSVTVTGPIDGGRAPIGLFESLTVSGTKATATGWSIDPDTAEPIKVRLTLGGTSTEVTANLPRPDVGSAYPASGAAHGFSAQITVPTGTSTVCAVGLNVGIGGDGSLGCRSVTVAAPTPVANKAPVGNFESLRVSSGALAVSGWAIDPNITGPIAVHIYVDGVGKPYTADVARPDVAAAYPGYGDKHGFVAQIPASPGSHKVCVYAIDDQGGPNPTLGAGR